MTYDLLQTPAASTSEGGGAHCRLMGQDHVDKFKQKLDKFLEKTPDQPDAEDLTKIRAATTNSLICQIPIYRRNHPEDFEEAENAA